MRQFTWAQAAAWRAARHHLGRRAPAGSMLAVARRLCGVQAQLMSSAELALWARVESLERDAVAQALWEERTLVKTWAMRGTLHLLPSADLPLWHAALGASPRFLRPAQWKKHFGLTMDDLDRLTEAIADALRGRLVTREELGAEVRRLTGSAAWGAHIADSSWGTVLRPAAFSGCLCFGPSLGQRVRFTHPRTWVAAPPPPKIEAPAAAAEIARRFLAAYGPATYHDLARWWNGGGIATARQWIASLGDEAAQVDLDGAPAWMLAADARTLGRFRAARSVRLLPAFDPYVIGASWHAARLLPGDLRSRVYRPQGWISPVLLVDGFLRGTWRHELRGARVEVVVEPFQKEPAWVRRAAQQEADRLAGFLGGPLSFAWKA